MTRGWPDEEGRRRRWRDTLLETRRFAGTLSIGVLATPAVNILPLTNPPGGPWVVLLTEKGRQIVQSERIEREGGRRGRTRENARWRARDARARKGGGTTRIARLVETERKEDGALQERGWWMLVHEGSSPLPTSAKSSSSSSSFSSSPSRLLCARRGRWALLSNRASYPILSSRHYPILTWLSLA